MNGVYAAAISHNWQVQTIDHMPDAGELHELLAVWNPIGCIVEDGTCQQRIDPRPFGKTPVVVLGRDYYRRRQVFDCIRQDQDEVAAAVMDAFRPNRLEHFAYFGDPESPIWCTEREQCFRKRISNRQTFSVYRGKSAAGASDISRIVTWIDALPKPCGVLLSADHVATTFFSALRKAGLSVPGDVVVVSVDNDEQICLNMRPQLTSVMPDYFSAGVKSVGLLAKRIGNPAAPPLTDPYGVHSVIRRASTGTVYANPRVDKAVVFIRDHACEVGFSVPDVVREMGCCRCLAERYFKAATRQTVLDFIRATRLAKAKSLMKSPNLLLDAIPLQCGYSSISHFKAFFRKETGMTMRAWRRKYATTKATG